MDISKIKMAEDTAKDWTHDARKARLILKAIDHKLRQRIIDLLLAEQPCTVTDVYVRLRLEQCVASQHLGILRRAGVVIGKREGKKVHYRVKKKRLARLLEIAGELAR